MKKQNGKPKPRKFTLEPAVNGKMAEVNHPKVDSTKKQLKELLKTKPVFGNVLQYPREWGEKLYPELVAFITALEKLAE